MKFRTMGGKGACLLIIIGFFSLFYPFSSRGNPSPEEYRQSLITELNTLLEENKKAPLDSVLLTRLSGLYLDMGDDLNSGKPQRIQAYEKGAKIAEKAIHLNNADPKAHFYYAANLGSAASLKGVFASLTTIRQLQNHVDRALELKEDYPPALHMKGMLLEELPWILGGDSKEALEFLQKAVAAKTNYAKARLDLAKAYIKRKNNQDARIELIRVIHMAAPSNYYSWYHHNKPEAEKLLFKLDQSEKFKTVEKVKTE
ncbi:MAG TPA: tetratricopeptide repeat protein [Nitrospiria bacterium]